MGKKQLKIHCNIEPAVNVCCMVLDCVNNVPGQWVCTQKFITIDEVSRKCEAYIKRVVLKSKNKKTKKI